MTALAWNDVAVACRAPTQTTLLHWPLIVEALEAAGLGHPLVQVAAAATVATETPGFAPVRERRANKERQPELYRAQARYWDSGYFGRGFIQHTWEAEYRTLSQRLGVDLLGQPDRLLEPELSARALADFFRRKGVDVAAVARDWPKVRRLINGGLNGWDHFKGHVDRLLTIPGVLA